MSAAASADVSAYPPVPDTPMEEEGRGGGGWFDKHSMSSPPAAAASSSCDPELQAYVDRLKAACGGLASDSVDSDQDEQPYKKKRL